MENLKIDKEKVLFVASVSFFLSFTLFVFGPTELYCSNAGEFWFSIVNLLPGIFISFILAFTVLTISLICVKNKYTLIFLTFIFGITFATYVQGNYINLDYGELNGQLIDWNSYNIRGSVNFLIWCIFFFSPFLLYKINRGLLKKLIKYGSFFISSIELITLIVLLISTPGILGNSNITVTKEKIYEVSKKENTIIFVLDTFDASWFDESLDIYPDISQTFSDFTYFPFASSGSAPTKWGIPLILSGQYDNNSMDYKEYLKKAYDETMIYEDMQRSNYDIRIFTEAAYLDQGLKGRVKNIELGQAVVSSRLGLTKKMFQFTAYKYAPHFLKKYFWFYSGEFDIYKDANLSYSFNDDVAFYKGLVNEKISITDEYNVFKVYHLFGAHGPYTMNEICERVDEKETSRIQQTKGALNIVSEYIQQLKELGVYNNTNLIVMADHGGIELYQNPLFLIKEAGKIKDTMEVSNAPVCFEDIIPTIAFLSLEDPSSYGRSIFDIQEDEERLRRHISPKILAEAYMDKEYEAGRIEFLIKGNVRERQSIIEIGEPGQEKEISEYTVGKEISFLPEGNSFNYTYSGVWGQETHGRWLSSKSLMKMRLTKVPEEDLSLKLKFTSISSRPQYLEVLVNGESLGEKKILDLQESFIIPKEMIDDEIFVLDFHFRNAIVPANISTATSDTRKISVFMEKMTLQINEEKPDLQNYWKIPNLSHTLDIDFSKTGNSEQYINGGWHAQEDSARWTSALSGISFSYNKNQAIYMNVTYKSFPNAGDTEVELNGYTIGVLKNTSEQVSTTLILPANFLNSKGVQTIDFKTSGATSPKEEGIGEDSRRIALNVASIKLNEE